MPAVAVGFRVGGAGLRGLRFSSEVLHLRPHSKPHNL